MARNIKKGQRKPSTKEKLKQRVLRFLSKNPTTAFTPKQLCKKIELSGTHNVTAVFALLLGLDDEGRVTQIAPEQFMIAQKQAETIIEGKLDHVSPSFAFLIVADDDDVKISRNNINGAMNGDIVRVGVFSEQKGRKKEGYVMEVLKRGKKEIVGVVDRSSKHIFVIPDNKKLHKDVFVSTRDNMMKVSDGDKVLVEITKYPEGDRNPEGRVLRVLGEAGTHRAEMNSIILEYDLPEEFPTEVEEESEAMSTEIHEAEIAKRKDFRGVTTFTVDPYDAKDFDDALSVKKLENGNYEIGVHIADVSHYVRMGTALEKEAYKRATSVYLVDRVIPMLPEKLSNGLCSLRPNEDKLCFSAVFEITTGGTIKKEWFGRTVIHSDRRFTYEEAQERIEGKGGDFLEEVVLLNEIAYKLREKRFKEGSISFESAEVKFVLDEEGTPIEVVPKARQDAHKMIEDFMLLANKKVATFVYNQKENNKPKTFVYRAHDNPNMEKLNAFANFARRFGHEMVFDESNVASILNKLGGETEGKPEETILQSLAVRTMAKAKYTTEPLGHFGLGFEHYSHFTSPIRRYPDMMVHRLLQRYLDGEKSAVAEEYEEKCEHSSEQEKVASQAERDSIKYKQVEFMSLKEADIEYPGIITGVTDFGIFVEMTETKCEGMIRVSDLKDDYYEFDADNFCLWGRSNKKKITFGDAVVVKVRDTNLRNRTIDLTFVD